MLPGARALDRVRIRIGPAEAELSLPAGVAVDRAELDEALFRRAAEVGVRTLQGARATVDRASADGRTVRVATPDGVRELSGRVVLDGTGLPAEPGGITPDSRVGLGQTRADTAGPLPGEVWMLAGRSGYVGLVRFADGTLNVAASVRADALEVGAGAVVDGILVEAGVDPLGWTSGWSGTRPLRRVRTRTPEERLLPIGDAAGFWEPFTGEGIGWALESGASAAGPALELAARWSERAARVWFADRHRWMRRVQRRSRVVGWLAAHPRVARVALPVLGAGGPLSQWVVPTARPSFDSAVPALDGGAS
jgi:flavin-dependent dehydrogenase